MLVRCPHCDHRILVRNARPRTYQLACPKCKRNLFLFIEGESGPDQRLMVFEDFELMKQHIMQTKAMRPTSRMRSTDPENRPERPEVIHGQSAGTVIEEDDDTLDFVVSQRPDSPMSPAVVDHSSMVSDAASPPKPEPQMDMTSASTRILPHAAPVAFSADDEDEELDLLEEALQQVNEANMVAPEESDVKVSDDPDMVDRPDSPRVMEEETAIHRQRPEFATVDEVIPTFPTDKQQQELHPDPTDTDHLYLMSAEDLQAAEPRMLLDLSNDEDDTAATDASMDEEKPVLPVSDNTPSKGWRRWFGKS